MRSGYRLECLVSCAPQGSSNPYRSHLPIARLPRIGLAYYLIFLCQPRIEHSAEQHIAGMPSGSENHAPARVDRDGLALAGGDYADHPPAETLLSNHVAHGVL